MSGKAMDKHDVEVHAFVIVRDGAQFSQGNPSTCF
jgi:hypothetical protein